jgi:hypothetical protein
MRCTLLAFAAVAALSGSARADTLPLILDQPPEYIPGGPTVSFTLHAPALDAFTSFHIELLFQTDNDPPDLTVGAIRPGDSAYPFGASGNFSGTPGSPEANTVRFIIDGSGDAVQTFAGLNDLLATITITPGPTLTGAILVSVDPNTVRFAHFSESGSDNPPDPFLINQGSPAAVPAPPAWLLMGIGGLGLATFRRGRTSKGTV